MASHIKESSTHQENKQALIDKCAVNGVLSFIGKRWLMNSLYEISLGNDQFTSLKANMSGISDHILAARVNDLVDQGLIGKREVKNSVPTEIKYIVTAKGKDLLFWIDGLNTWDAKWKDSRSRSARAGFLRKIYFLKSFVSVAFRRE